MDYKETYNKDYFTGKKSLLYKFGYGSFTEQFFENIFNSFKKYIHGIESGKMLDVGCAFGLMLEKFPKSFDKFGIDVSEYAIQVAKEKFPDDKFFACEAEKDLPFPEDYFDIVLCNDVFEHLESPGKAIKNIHRVMKKGGLLLATTPNLNLFRKTFLKSIDKNEYHISMYRHRDMLGELEKAGFKIVDHWTSITTFRLFFLKFKSNIGTESFFVCKK